MGKPSPEFFQMALSDLEVGPEDAAMVGDDILTDVKGAQRMGMQGILVKTGKYRDDLAASSGVVPDLVLESLASLAENICRIQLQPLRSNSPASHGYQDIFGRLPRIDDLLWQLQK
jgi:ribonucleotide monophosphatase NagD (HAD superfamily)